jgi:hypothetical protein
MSSLNCKYRLAFHPLRLVSGTLEGRQRLYAEGRLLLYADSKSRFNALIDQEFRKVLLPASTDDDEIDWALESYVYDPFQFERSTNASIALSRQHQQIETSLDIGSFLEKNSLNLQRQRLPLDILDMDFTVKLLLEKEAYRLPRWELLERRSVSCNGPALAVRHILSLQAHTIHALEEPFNILLVVSRRRRKLGEQEDIRPRLVSLPLQSLVGRLPKSRVHMDIARPGTFEAFQRYLRGDRKYDLVHLDVHGNVEEGERQVPWIC